MDKEGFGALDSIQIVFQISPESFNIFCILHFVGMYKIQKFFVAEHVAGQDPGGLAKDIGDGYLIKMVDPQLRTDLASQF